MHEQFAVLISFGADITVFIHVFGVAKSELSGPLVAGSDQRKSLRSQFERWNRQRIHEAWSRFFDTFMVILRKQLCFLPEGKGSKGGS